MAFEIADVSTLSDAIPQAIDFAGRVGFTVSGGNTLAHPSMAGAEAFTFSVAGDDFFLSPAVPGGGKPQAVFKQPTLYDVGSIPPSKVYMFGSLSPAPYLALAFEFGSLHFRHIYFGHVEKRGSFVGGELLSACSAEHVNTTQSFYERHPHQYLFRASQSRRIASQSGGVRVQHANNANTWRTFKTDLGGFAGLDGTEVIGGFPEGPVGGFLANGNSIVPGRHMTAPIELYIPRNIGGPTELTPIGRVPGVRHVNMQNYNPADRIEIGQKYFRVFPAFRKSAALKADAPPSLPNFPVAESSYYLGYAYAEE